MIKKAIAGGLDSFRRAHSGLTPATRAQHADYGPEVEEMGQWHYLVTDSAGIRPRSDACYSKECKVKDSRYPPGTVVEVDKRLRSGWTKWLSLSSGEGWVFDVSPKDRKVRMVEVEVQRGEWQYEVCAEQLPVLPRPQLGATPASAACLGQLVTAVERVRPLVRRGAFLRLVGFDGWVLDFLDGSQTLRRCCGDSTDDGRSVQTSPPLSPKKGHEDLLGEPEYGDWKYAVLDPKGVTLRCLPTYEKSAKLQSRLEQGEIVNVVERCSATSTMFLRMDIAGQSAWAFDTQPGAVSCMRMSEVIVERGCWWYRVINESGCALRSRCSTVDASKLSIVLERGALFKVGQRVQVGDTKFLRLWDGSGWLFDRKDGKPIVTGPEMVQWMRSVSATVVAEQGVHLRKAPTDDSWAKTKMVLLQHAKVVVTFKAFVEGRQWLEVKKSSMEGWVPATAIELDFDVTNAPAWSR